MSDRDAAREAEDERSPETAEEAAGAEAGTNEGQTAANGEAGDALERAERERDEYLELAQRARADLENYRKRTARESADAAVRGKAELAREMLPAIDNLERAVRAAGVPAGDDPRADGEAPSREVTAHEALGQGVALVHRELEAGLARSGIEPFDPTGERFDPALHEAVSTRPAEDGEAGEVVETLERGWRLGSDVLRPARVVVGE